MNTEKINCDFFKHKEHDNLNIIALVYSSKKISSNSLCVRKDCVFLNADIYFPLIPHK